MNKPFSPSSERNRQPILDVLRARLGGTERVLEIGSGTGQHAVFFAAAMPGLLWQCSDLQAEHDGIRLWLAEAGLPNVPPPVALDVNDGTWPVGTVDVVFTANTLHIMDFASVRATFTGAARVLARDGQLIAYGPFSYGGRHTSAGNEAFDRQLRATGSGSGIRDLVELRELAAATGFELMEDVAMPANNRTLFFRYAARKPSP